MDTTYIIVVWFKLNIWTGKILSDNKTYVYYAQYRDSINNIILEDTIRFVTTDKIRKYKHNKQKVVFWKYKNLVTDSLTKSKLYSNNWYY